MEEKGKFTEEELGLILCQRTKDNTCSICGEKWCAGSECPNGHKEGLNYLVKQNMATRRRKIKCQVFSGNRCSICGSYIDGAGVCNHQHIVGEWYEI